MDSIPNDVLKLILPLIDSPICLIRAAATCKNWRRIIAADGILSRFLSLHAPPVAGVYYNSAPSPDQPEPPAFIPSPTGAAIYSRHFSLDFLPEDGSVASGPWAWRIVDSRGSLLLLVRRPPGDEGFTLHGDHEVVVCEPLTRRMERISPCAETGRGGDGDTLICTYLIDGEDDGGGAGLDCATGISMSKFRVLCVVYGNYRYRSRVFTSGGSWREISIDSERMNRLIDLMGYMGHGMAMAASSLQHRVVAGGIGSQRMDLMGITTAWLYWYTGGSMVVAVDRSTAEATSFVLPVGAEDWDCLNVSGLVRVTDGPNGSVRLVVSEAGGNVKIYAWIHGVWVLEKRMSIPPPAVATMGGAEPPHSHFKPWELLTVCAPLIVVSPYQDGVMWRLCLDGETAELKRIAGVPYPCKLPWPLPFHSYTDP
ncbi:hypothetical protein U9M48_014040 [Paspalum notatum var. saurae]|uniref:F-box domain-containing protein n=1 Tax=Paspalum notatum var. saurae TaxID=547442 RepID=A0AAQ3WK66_PASNO